VLGSGQSLAPTMKVDTRTPLFPVRSEEEVGAVGKRPFLRRRPMEICLTAMLDCE
jgi:hypothetical protein